MRKASVSIAVLGLVAAQFIGTTGANAAARCKPFKPTAPETASSNGADAEKEKVVLVTEKATESKPIVFEYSHGPAMADGSMGETLGDPHATMLVEDARFFNFQVVEDARASSVNARIEWGSPSPSDIDLRFYGQSGTEIDYSASFNPIQDPSGMVISNDDANGMEQLLGIWVPRCGGFTVESRPAWSPGEDAVTLKVWLD